MKGQRLLLASAGVVLMIGIARLGGRAPALAQDDIATEFKYGASAPKRP